MLPSERRRVRRALERGFDAIGRKLPSLIDPPSRPRGGYVGGAESASEYRRRVELEQRETLQALELGRELVRRGVELEQAAEQAKRAGVEVLRCTRIGGEPWEAIAELLGMSKQGAHKRYRDVEAPEPELTIDDELERAR